MGNTWVVQHDAPFVQWEILLPKLSSPTHLQPLLAFASGLLEIGEREAIFRVVNTTSSPQSANYQSYLDFIQQNAAQTNKVHFFDNDDDFIETKQGALKFVTRVCYYDSLGEIIETETNDLGSLLRSLRPDEVEPHGYYWMSREPPVTIFGRSFPIDYLTERNLRLVIQLWTDIWFPWVKAPIDEFHKSYEEKRIMRDNRILAACHTPRLNRFISGVRELTLTCGGSWRLGEFPDPFAEAYATMVSETGITLEQKAD